MKTILVLLTTILLSACGGGGGEESAPVVEQSKPCNVNDPSCFDRDWETT